MKLSILINRFKPKNTVFVIDKILYIKSNLLLFQCIWSYVSNLVMYKSWTEMTFLLLHMITLHIHLGTLYYSKQKQV